MKKMLATALLALALTGSALAPTGGVAFAAMDTTIDQTIVDPQGLSNIEYTQDNSPSTQDAPSSSPSNDRCHCVVVPEAAPAA